MSRVPSQGPRRERGQALVETALTAMIVMLLLLALVDFGLAFGHRVVLVNASRAGARFGSRYPFLGDTIDVAVIDSLKGTLVLDAAYVEPPRDDRLRIIVACQRGAGTVLCANAYRGDSIRVTVEYDYEFMFGTLLGVPDVTLRSSTVMYVASPPVPTPVPSP